MTQPTDAAAALKLTKARVALLMDHPFFGTLALHLRFVEDYTLPTKTLAVDGRNMYYHPDWVNENTHDVVKSGVAHEVGHCVFDHIKRRNGRSARRWNRAGDYAINLVLKDAGFTVPQGWLINPGFANMSADQIYNMLPEGESPDKDFDEIRESADDQSDDTPNWQIITVQAANAARAQGKLPDSLNRFVTEMLSDKVDWRSRLRRFVTEESEDDYSYMRLNRKAMSMGLYLPGLYSQNMDTLVVVSDDSGSIGNDILSMFGAEAAAARDAVRPTRTLVISCDAAVNHVEDLVAGDEFKLESHGGGGTDFRPPFAWLEEQGIVPSCLLYLTDMYGVFPETAPPYPVLWCAITDEVAPWGETLRIES